MTKLAKMKLIDYFSIFDTYVYKYSDAQHVTCCAFVVNKNYLLKFNLS